MNWDLINSQYPHSFAEFLAEEFQDTEESNERIDPNLSKFEFVKKYDLRFYGNHNLFEYFDGKQIFISIDFYSDEFEHGFNYTIRFNFRSDDENPHDEDFDYNSKRTRSETEIAAFTRAFKIREKQLQEVKP